MFVGIKAVLNTESVASSMSYTNPSKLRICQCKTSTWIVYTGLKTDATLMNIQREELCLFDSFQQSVVESH